MNNIQNITEKTEIDETVEEYEYHSYEPITGTNLKILVKFELILKRRTCSHTRVKVIWFSTVSW